MPNLMPNSDLQKFSRFYRQSCDFKKRLKNHQAKAGQSDRTDTQNWLKCFTGSNRPFWINGQSVSNLVCAMRNYRFTIHRDGHDLIILYSLIGEVAVKLNAQEIANTLLALNKMGVHWVDIKVRGLSKSCGKQLIATLKTLMRRILPILCTRSIRWVYAGMLCLKVLAKSCGK